jgi:hypothetical protein
MQTIPWSKDESDRHSWAFYAKEMPLLERLEMKLRTDLWEAMQLYRGQTIEVEWLDEVCELGRGAYRVNAAPGQVVLVNEPLNGAGFLTVNPLPVADRPLPVLQNLSPYRTWLATEVCIPLRLSFTDDDLWLREGGVTIVRTVYDDLREVEGTEGSPEPRKSSICGKLPPAELAGNYKPCDKLDGHTGSHEYEPRREHVRLVNENIPHEWDKSGFCVYCHNVHRTDKAQTKCVFNRI